MKTEVTRPSLPPFEEFCEEIRPLWESRILTNMGPKHEAFRETLAARCGCPGITLFTNGHLALEAALAAMHLPAGSEVITTPLTFVSTTHAIVRRGLKPVFCDVLAQDGTMDPEALEAAVTPRTSAILPVHVYGNPCDGPQIGEIARRKGLKLVYDAAHAFGVSYRGESLLRWGDASVLSFHATKALTTVEGGAVCCRDLSLSGFLDDEKNFGIRDREHCEAIGGNAKMSELQAAMGLCNLRHFDEAVARRKALTGRYRSLLEERVGWLLPREGTVGNYSYLPVLLDSPGRRDAAAEALEKEGIVARKYFWPLTSRLGCYRDFNPGHTPIAEDLAARVLTLPLYPDLPEEEIQRICLLLSRFL